MNDVLDSLKGQKPEPADTETVSKKDFDELKEKLDAKTAEVEQIKKAQAGSDAKVDKLLKELEAQKAEKQAAIDAAKQQGMSELEKVKADLEAMKKREADAIAKANQSEFLNKAKGLLSEKGISSKYVTDRMLLAYLGDPEGLEGYLNEFAEEYKANVNIDASNQLKQNVPKPKSGSPIDGKKAPDWASVTNVNEGIEQLKNSDIFQYLD